MKSPDLVILFLAIASLAAPKATMAQSETPEPKASSAWFQRASDQMDLRRPGSAPFHMRVSFHASPGIEFPRSKERSQIVVGDGLYEETWLAPHTWRREVTFADYHALEVESDKGRKMLASSDYEPSRVLMVLSALLSPVPRDLVSLDSRHHVDSGWASKYVNKGEVSLVRVSNSEAREGLMLENAYYFLPKGLLLFKNELGLTTAWQDGFIFADRVVARHITVSAGERELVTSDVFVEPASQMDPSSFELASGIGDPGMTLRPLRGFARSPRTRDDPPMWPGNRRAALSLLGVVDRTGRFRELEVIVAIDADAMEQFMEDYRKYHWRPAEIDGSPCEYLMATAVNRIIQTNMNR